MSRPRPLRQSLRDLAPLSAAALAILAARIALRLLPFGMLHGLLSRIPATGTTVSRRKPSVERVAWAVRAASRHLPGRNDCLIQAIATQALLALGGHPASIHLGVAGAGSGRLRAHAWVVAGGEIVSGGSNRLGYTPLAALPERR